MTPPFLARALSLAAIAAASILPAWSDVAVRTDGRRIEGDVVAVDSASVVVDTPEGRVTLPRDEVASILFGPKAPRLKVEIRNVRSDDAATVLLDGEPVIVDARGEGAWTDVTDRLKEGNNEIRLRIRNDRGTWAYRIHVRVNGKVSPIACGTPLVRDDPCREGGHTGVETGEIDVGPFWLNVDRALGRAELLP